MWQPFIQGLRLRGVDEGGPAAGAGAAVAAGQVRLALLTPLPPVLPSATLKLVKHTFYRTICFIVYAMYTKHNNAVNSKHPKYKAIS